MQRRGTTIRIRHALAQPHAAAAAANPSRSHLYGVFLLVTGRTSSQVAILQQLSVVAGDVPSLLGSYWKPSEHVG